ncbi:UDP-4-amino-4,6-dideoxy-N-acetyl-beta-L-altrosamine transaminase [Thalassotalea euphylliae]|uniref:UDP-4-amino-4, 6-dideoxy-N-acetyl-beta-L-altrosamine transaminase n=1 Tax=Thalassotalea euphylliae TaxID=1655234 RepID=A0A3E0UCX5_9GAMM|nr:UDP-4-amino-4,6-dideoxy-N-acetyl-beta-L-altrosamine transaminase [Thalassotalea euphylliae]REL34848.1 UDP-4-amino-4,6-dideoxy-N-acetyl-beta-L-altrosamine transaminase [Thalassotalea euphylliae]
MIPYGKQQITEQDIDAVVDVLRSDFLTQGPIVNRFEQAVAEKCQAKFALATNSATSALHIACLALDIGQGDIVWTSPISFVASANCALYCGASIDFVDIDRNTANMSTRALAEKLALAKRQDKLPKAIIVVHMAGLSCDMVKIGELARQYQVKIIEDASHAIGGAYQSEPVGHCQFSDICVFSFHPVKVITSAEGGMALTNCEQLAKKMEMYRSHGITKDTTQFQQFSSNEPWSYEQQLLGFNYRMSDLHAALGLSQLNKLDDFVAQRNALAKNYRNAFEGIPIGFQQQSDSTLSAYHLMLCQVESDSKLDRDTLFNTLRAKGIGCQIHYIPIHLQPYFQQLGYCQGDFPVAEQYYKTCISLPLFPGLDKKSQTQIIETITKLLS